MALYKAIASGKERRRPWRGAKALSRGCENHGSCAYCRRNRRYRTAKRHPVLTEEDRVFFRVVPDYPLW